MQNQYALALYQNPDHQPQIARLDKAIAEFTNLETGTENVLRKLVRQFPDIAKTVDAISVLANEYEQLLLTRSSLGVSVKITEISHTLTALVNDTTTVTSKVDEKTITRYTRLLRSRFHPDKKGNQEVFDLILKASKAHALEVLYLYMMVDNPEEFEFDQFEKMMGAVAQKKAKLRASKAFNIAQEFVAGRSHASHALMLKALDMRRLNYITLLTGSAFVAG